jgi:hypothetical protein
VYQRTLLRKQKDRGWGKGKEMTQTLYAHTNKIKIKKKESKKMIYTMGESICKSYLKRN